MTNTNPTDTKKSTIVPAAGMGATLIMFTDRRAYSITRVSPSGKVLWATRDIAKRTDNNGMSDCQTYEHTTDPTAAEERFNLGSKGWRGKSGRLVIGNRNTYHDFSF